MKLEEAVFTTLKDDADVGAKVAAGGGNFHIYPLRLPEDYTPNASGLAITYTEITQQFVYPLLRESKFQFNCFALTFGAARDLADDVDDALNDLQARLLGGAGGFPITYVKFLDRQALFDDTAKLWYYIVNFSIKY